MGQRLRHYKALMRKNQILWRRTLCSSLCELFCPVALMALITLTRFAVETESIAARSYLNETAMFHQSIYPDKLGSSDTANPYSALEVIQEQEDFYNFIGINATQANPLFKLDLKSCRSSEYEKEKTVVAFGPNSTVSWQIAKQVNETSKIQFFQNRIVQQQKLLLQYRREWARMNNNYNFTSTLLNAALDFIDLKIVVFKDYDEIRDYLQSENYQKEGYPGICFGFSLDEKGQDDIEARIIFNDQYQDQEGQMVPHQGFGVYSNFSTQAKQEEFERYTLMGFSLLHNFIINSVLQSKTNNQDAHVVLGITPFHVDGYIKDSFSLVIENMLPFFMLLMYILPVYRTISRILSEKESRARESMKMMGLKDFSYWLSWFTYYTIVVTIISILCTILLSFKVIQYSNQGIVFLYFWCYGMSLFGFIVFFQSFFSNARTGALTTTLAYFGSSFIDAIVQDPSVKESSKIGASFFSTVAVSRGAYNFGKLEESGIGLNFDNASALIDNFRFSWALIMMAIQFFSLLILGLYLENVLPSQYGIRKPLYFFLTKKYWFGDERGSAKIEHSDREDIEDQEHLELKYLKRENFEVPSGEAQKKEKEQKILRIQELKKKFDNGFEAVKGLNVRMYNGEIFALLGHNGAGKTTTISMLTGLISSSSGKAEVFGYDLFNEMNQVRQFMGVCPQHDILFDLLSPYEHLQIFCDFKGVDVKDKDKEITHILKEVDLYSYKDVNAKSLSGGSRRKLSVAIALIGGSKFVLLDEPTAGMDLTARRRLWNMLEKQKKNRIIILTTHYMDEADILGDRIGIMAGGQLICLGSSLFLKNRFGVGYKITMVKNDKSDNTKVGPYLESKLGTVKKLSEVSSEITYQIPTNASSKFKSFFDEFDNQLSYLGIKSYGISITTLEEVFLTVGHGLEHEKEPNLQSIKQEELLKEVDLIPSIGQFDDDYSVAEQHETGVCNIFLLHLGALFMKRYQISKKNIKGFVIEILVPILMIIIGFSFSKVTFFFDSPERLIQPSLLPLKQRILANQYLVKQSPYDIPPQQLLSYLPDYESAFDITYKDYSYVQSDETKFALLQKMDEDIFNQRKVGEPFPYRYGSYYIYEANNQTKQFKVATFVNTTSTESTVFYSQFIYEAILRAATGNPDFKFKVINAPFPVTQKLRDREASSSGIFIVFIIGIGFSLIPASIISYIVGEREKNLKHMQLISGMNLAAYWISNYIFDILKTLITMGIAIGLLYAYSLKYDNVWILFIMYPIGVIPFTYAMSFLFQQENTAQTLTIFLHFIFSGIGGIVVLILKIIESTKKVGKLLNWVFKIVPSFSLTNSIMFASSKNILAVTNPESSQDDLAMENMGGDILVVAFHFILWTIFITILEGGLLKCLRRYCRCKDRIKPRDDLELDQDVLAEEQRAELQVENIKMKRIKPLPQQVPVVVHNFRKVYQNGCKAGYLAVEKASFQLEFGECFALLGVNGAGKTTTFKSLTQDIEPTSGDIYINGMNVKNQFTKIRKLIGYCPQFDCIFDQMSVEEHLNYYAMIKGILKSKRKQLVEKQINEMNLQKYRNVAAGTLSGGNKRKLSVAMSLLGNPPIILLDEPSAGMDPQARRFMWTIVAKVSQLRKKSAVILTTHSMEEAEALSTKMGIMVKGGIFRCFGSSQHIKNKYGTGYEVEVKIRKTTASDLENMMQLFGFDKNEERIQLTKCIEIMRSKNINEIIVQEIRKNGLGAELYHESIEDKSGLVTVKNFLNWLNIELHGLSIIFTLVNEFQSVELLEHYNDYFKFRVPKQNKSIGYLFGLIENQKEQFGISEYSVGQTTLEQIFQTFANLEIDKDEGTIFEKNSQGQVAIKHKALVQKKQSQVMMRSQ